MMTAGCFLRVALFALLAVATCGFSQKGSQSSGQSSSGSSAAASYASYQGGAPSFASAPFSATGGPYGAASMPAFQSGPSVYQPVLVAPVMSGSGSSAALGVGAGGVGSLGVGAGGVAPLGMQGDGGVSPLGVQGIGVSAQLGTAYMSSPVLYEPAESSAGPQDGPATQWTVPTTIFEDGADTQAISDLLPQAPSGPQGPTLQSGEASSVVKEAELGNYQQQTEEFGYPADLAGSGQQGFGRGLASVLVPGGQLGGFRPVSAGRFDRMLLYGMLPPGSYSTFSQNHEAGKDYSQAVHYLKEHVTDGQGSGQQKKFFPGAQ